MARLKRWIIWRLKRPNPVVSPDHYAYWKLNRPR